MSQSIAANEEIARRVPEEIATQKNADTIEEVFAEDAIEHGPFGEEIQGITAMRESFQQYWEAFPDLSVTVEDAVTQGDTVAMRVTLRGTHEGEFMGIEPTNKSFEVQNMVFTRVSDGKITERWLQPDALGMFQQLGIVSLPQSAE